MGNIVRYSTTLTPTAGNDMITYITAASRRSRLVSVYFAGKGASSAAQEAQIGRSTAGTTPGGAVAGVKHTHTDQPAAVGTTATTWAAQPTIDTSTVAGGFNALGGAFVKEFVGVKAIEARNAENISIRAPSSGITFQSVDVTILVEED